MEKNTVSFLPFSISNGPLAKVWDMVRQAHHEREKINNFILASVHPELVEG
jgi:hypothetical protein